MINNIEKILKSLNLKLLNCFSLYNKIYILFCLHTSGCHLFLNIFNLNVMAPLQSPLNIRLQRLESLEDIESNKISVIYQEVKNTFPNLTDRIVLGIQNFLIVDSSSVFRCLHDHAATSSFSLFPTFFLSKIYGKTLLFEENLILFHTSIMEKVNQLHELKISPILSFDNLNTFDTNYNKIIELNRDLSKIKELYQNMIIMEKNLMQQLKESEASGYYGNKHDIEQRKKLKPQIKVIANLVREAEIGLLNDVVAFLNSLILFIFYKKDIYKKTIEIESSLVQYQKTTNEV